MRGIIALGVACAEPLLAVPGAVLTEAKGLASQVVVVV